MDSLRENIAFTNLPTILMTSGRFFASISRIAFGIWFSYRVPVLTGSLPQFPGYIGSTCKDHISNLCLHTPCENNATCQGNSTHFKCHCLPGYTGVHCEVNINECQSNPCQHGVCKDSINGYQCYCKPGKL